MPHDRATGIYCEVHGSGRTLFLAFAPAELTADRVCADMLGRHRR